ncbi:MAG: methionyl-tRNA formyltransferase [Actinomycetota bacterium]
MKIIFAGSPNNAASALRILATSGFDIVGVLTRTDSVQGRKKSIEQTAVAKVATELGVALFKTNRIDDQARDWIRNLKPDLGIVVAYGCILRNDDLEIPPYGWINLHYSLLPDFPGPAPVQHAILSGRSETGVTVFRLDEGVDTGDIISAKRTEIFPGETSGDLLERLSAIGNQLLVETISDFAGKLASAKPQPKGSAQSVAFKPTRESAHINITRPALEIERQIRAMNPEPMAWLHHDGNPIRIHRAAVGSRVNLASGELVMEDKQVFLGCGMGTSLKLIEVKPAGKKSMSAQDWYRGLREFVVT